VYSSLFAPQRISFKLAVMVYQCTHGLGLAYLADALQPVAKLTTRAVVVDFGIGCSTYMTVQCWRPSVPCRRSTDMEEFAS